ncbi:MAG: PocR ligand-binding domain-containing protein [Bacillota bacterium]
MEKNNDFQIETDKLLNFIQNFQDEFAASLGIASVTVDLEGEAITSPSGFTRFCEYIRSSELGLKRCKECDRKGGEKAEELGEPVVYECHAGLCDFAVPIVIGDKQIASVLGGQILAKELHEKEIRELAQELALNPDKLVKLINDVYALERNRIESAANMLGLVVNTISEMWYQQSELKIMASDLSSNLSEISATLDEMSLTTREVNEKQTLLNEKINNVDSLSAEIEQFVNIIERIANKTKFSLNTAMESPRAGKVAHGFDVVAQKIRKLSQDSKQKVDKIKEIVPQIQSSTNQTTQMAKDTLEQIEEQSANIEDLNELSTQLSKLAN